MTEKIPHINVHELKELLASSTEAVILLDVREPWEIQFAEVLGSTNIPMNLVPDRLSELSEQANIVVMCHHGGRSLAVAQYLAHHGYSRITNLTGGIHAWSSEIDGDVPQY